jgi:hypothetical protein
MDNVILWGNDYNILNFIIEFSYIICDKFHIYNLKL